MIKKVETIEDVLAILDIAPNLAKVPLHDDDGLGLLDETDDTIGTFYDDVKKDVFKVWEVYSERSDLTFYMKESLCYFEDVKHEFHKQGVHTWHWGRPDSKEDSIDWITKSQNGQRASEN